MADTKEKCTGCDPAEGFCRDCREAEQAKGQAAPVLAVKAQMPEGAMYSTTGGTVRLWSNSDLLAYRDASVEEARRDVTEALASALRMKEPDTLFKMLWKVSVLADAQRTAGGDAVPLFWLSSQQVYGLDQITGVYLPFQREPGGNFDFPVFDRKPVAEAAAQADEHLDDYAVNAFAAAMRVKMAASRAKGRGGWDDDAQCSAADLQRMLLEHLAKGDPVDVGNFAMMLWNRNERTAAPTAQPTPCTNSDSWNCKYCRKTASCEALKDSRNFASPTSQPKESEIDIEQLRAKLDALLDYPEGSIGAAMEAECFYRWRAEHVNRPGWEDTDLFIYQKGLHDGKLAAQPTRLDDERAEWSFKQWWAHVGAWETPEGFISFGSPMAVRAMLIQFGRMVEARAALRQPGALPDGAGDQDDAAELLDWLDRRGRVSFSFESASIEFEVPDALEGANSVRELIRAAAATKAPK